MFDHVTIGASSLDASRRFYDTVLGTLGHERAGNPELPEWEDLSLAPAGDDRPVTRGLHIGFGAPSRAHVEAFWRAGVDAGYRSDGEPGPRPEYGDDYFGAFLLDPDGNSAEAVVHDDLRTGAVIDHLWWRVRDRDASRRFYATIAASVGLHEAFHRSDRTCFDGGPGRGDFSIVDGDAPTTPFHLAFEAPDPETVAAFHRAAVGAGFTDNGAPGERPEYHPGYFGAFVLDPDGHNVEAVHHDRSG